MAHASFCGAMLLALIGLPLTSTQSVVAQDIAAMESVLKSRVCPSDRTTYDNLTYKGYGCTPVPTGYEFQCQLEVDRLNKVIEAHRAFMKAVCSKPQSSSQTGSPKSATPSNPTSSPSPKQTDKATIAKTSPWAEKAKETERRAAKADAKASPWAEKAKETERRAAKADEVNKQNAALANQQAREIHKTLEDRRLAEERRKLAEDIRINNERRRKMEIENLLRGLTCTAWAGGRVCSDSRLAELSYRCLVIDGVNTLILSPDIYRNHNNVRNISTPNCGVTNRRYIRMPW